MDPKHLRTWKHTLASRPTRREVLRGFAGAGLGLGLFRLPDAVAAKSKGKGNKKKKGKKRKQPRAVVNQYGCLAVGQPCHGDSTRCCSGICAGAAPRKGKPDQSRCVAHDTGSCKQEGEGICTAGNPAALKCNNDENCACITTTAGSNFCYDGRANQTNKFCTTCSKDADCEAQGYPPGSACAPISTGVCAGICATGMACMAPCGTVPPGP